MAANLPADLSAVVLDGVTSVLEAVADGSGGRRRFCEATAALFGCVAVGHAWVDLEHHAWSLCLWRWSTHGASSQTLTGVEREVPGDVLGVWWPTSACRRTTMAGIVAPHLVEVPLDSGAATCRGILVLGRETAFASEDLGLLARVLPYIAALERTMLRLESPRLPTHDGALTVTEREVEVLRLLSAGLIARSIAHRMSVSERTVHKHLENVYHKLEVHDRLSAVIRAQQLGLLAGPLRPAEPPRPEAQTSRARFTVT